jgi:hypothetical protein
MKSFSENYAEARRNFVEAAGDAEARIHCYVRDDLIGNDDESQRDPKWSEIASHSPRAAGVWALRRPVLQPMVHMYMGLCGEAVYLSAPAVAKRIGPSSKSSGEFMDQKKAESEAVQRRASGEAELECLSSRSIFVA